MEGKSKTQFNEQLRERTMSLALNIRSLLLSKNINAIDRPIFNQLIRSSSSGASNYRAATRGRSDAEFYSKICIVVEETDETYFWLDYLTRAKVLSSDETTNLLSETEQLVRLFATIRKRMKEKINPG